MAGTCCLSGLGGRMRQIGEEQVSIHSVNQVVRALNSDFLFTRALTTRTVQKEGLPCPQGQNSIHDSNNEESDSIKVLSLFF